MEYILRLNGEQKQKLDQFLSRKRHYHGDNFNLSTHTYSGHHRIDIKTDSPDFVLFFLLLKLGLHL